mmetsp:Transcript_29743/g.86709  ORF Transcript_29743/g.86709 Transcript_29743/m.86709 type:complete len:112 (+) Transcript_29743:389-724(+)
MRRLNNSRSSWVLHFLMGLPTVTGGQQGQLQQTADVEGGDLRRTRSTSDGRQAAISVVPPASAFLLRRWGVPRSASPMVVSCDVSKPTVVTALPYDSAAVSSAYHQDISMS